jgi:hypothetical protein
MEIARLAVLTNPPISDHMGGIRALLCRGVERLACSVNTGLKAGSRPYHKSKRIPGKLSTLFAPEGGNLMTSIIRLLCETSQSSNTDGSAYF